MWTAYFDPNNNHALVNTVEANKLKYSKREVLQSEKAKALMYNLGFPSVADMSEMMSKTITNTSNT